MKSGAWKLPLLLPLENSKTKHALGLSCKHIVAQSAALLHHLYYILTVVPQANF